MHSYVDMSSYMSVEVDPVERVVKAKRAAGAGSPTPPPSIMTADTGLETQGSAGVEVIGCTPSPLKMEAFAAACDLPFQSVAEEPADLAAALRVPQDGPRMIEVRVLT